MAETYMTPEEIRREGMRALQERLGVDGMIRFIMLFDRGSGDYTEERHEWLDQLTLDDFINEIEKARNKKIEA